ncbi:hypothetical protein SADUNF_Sadunf16G0084600 [Salix dunnii]|uniref:Soul heme-binding family protein n=1 Tax=Salix dunnii TaxID=1413687 RepID=A0A835MG04_9ROSI|nr:hypothetical protein SADUNF_Sadunf16G0084600 [Salix dunnii]
MARVLRQSRCKQAIESPKMLLSNSTPPVLTMIRHNSPSKIRSMSTDRTTATSPQRRPMSAFEARVSLVLALTSQASYQSQRLLFDLANETTRYLFPKRYESRNFEEALMAVPDLETLKYKVLCRKEDYEIREVEPYFIAETTMSGKSGFDFNGASQSFNVLAEYLFGKNTKKERMEMTTPVITRKTQPDGEKMEMTTPVITKKMGNQDKWQMSFVMPSKYGANLPLPKDPSVRIEEVPGRVIAVVAFSGFVTDEEVKQRELKLRDALKKEPEFVAKESASVEVAQVNTIHLLLFHLLAATRLRWKWKGRENSALEVERKGESLIASYQLTVHKH